MKINHLPKFLEVIQDCVLCDTKDMERDAWLAVRLNGIGGSEASAVMNRNPYDSPLAVYLQKLQLVPPKELSDAMHFGNVLEPIVAAEFSRRSGFEVFEIHKMMRHPVYDFLLANVDRVIYDEVMGFGILECKTASAYKQSEWENGKTPDHYYIQIQHYLAVTGLKFAYAACLIGGQVFRYNYVERDEALIEKILEELTNFWFEHIIPKVAPDVSHLDTDAPGKLYPQHEEMVGKNLGDEEDWMWDALVDAKKATLQAEQNEELAINRLKSKMGNAELLYLFGEKIATWKTNVKGVRTFKPILPKEE